MRILIGYLTNVDVGGINKYILNFVSSLNDDYEIDLVTSKDRVALGKGNIVHLTGKKNIHIIRISPLKSLIKQYKKFNWIYKKSNYDAVYFNISEASNCIGVLCARNNNIKKIIVHSHSAGINESGHAYRMVKKAAHTIAKYTVIKNCVTMGITCSDKAAKWMFPKHMKLCSDIKMVYNTVEFDRYRYKEEVRIQKRDELGIDEKALVLGFVGSFCYQKNNFFLIDILKKLKQKKDNVILLLVGDGRDLEQVKKYTRKHQIMDCIKFLGERTDVPDLFQAMDIFLLPSRFEGFPFAAVEAQLSGLITLISSTVTREVQITNKCHFIEIKSPNKWVDVILSFHNFRREEITINDKYACAEQNRTEITESILNH